MVGRLPSLPRCVAWKLRAACLAPAPAACACDLGTIAADGPANRLRAANMCDTIDLDGQGNLGSGMPAAGGSGDNQYHTGVSVDQTKLNSAVGATFTCADGYELDTSVKYVCNYATSVGGAAVFDGQLCKPITCETCTGTATGADAGQTCDLDASTDGTASCPAGCDSTAGSTTDAWCVFIQDTTDRANGVDCAADTSHVWCQCLASAASLTGGSTASANAAWLNDGQCHPVFDTGACHHDGGDCSGTHASSCETELQTSIRPACCTTSDCSPLPEAVTESCARLMIPFWSRCAYEVELPYLPMWVWSGMAAAAVVKLDSFSDYCATPLVSGSPTVSYSIRQRCDANCDCADCSDEVTDSHGNACVHPHTGSFCNSAVALNDKICTCKSGVQIPFEWVCDASDDCGMGEDETAAACQENPVNLAMTVWGESYPVTGETRACVSRWRLEVATACTGLDAAGAASSSCSPACAAEYLDWYMDCKQSVFNVTDTTVYNVGANEFFDCCLSADAASSTRQCAAITSLGSCEGDGTSLAISSLGDGSCDAKLDCDAYLEDAGDCATVVTVTLPFAVDGTFSANDFVSALVTPNNFLQDDDVAVIHYQQTITAELNLGCNYDGAVNAVLLGSPSGQAQLKSGIASWLGVQEHIVSIGAITSSTVSGNEVVNVQYTVTNAHKDISEEYTASDSARANDLLSFLDAANPQAIPVDMASCGTHFTASAPAPAPQVVSAALSVQTSIRVQVRVVEVEYELAAGALTGTDSERAAGMQTSIVNALQDHATILTYLNAAAGCSPDCITSVTPQTDELEVNTHTPEGSVIAELTESELALAVAIILVLVIGGCVCCVSLLICTIYWYKRKQKRQVLLVDQAGNIIKEWEEEADSAEREVLMQVLHHYIEEQEKSVKEAQEREEEELIATLEAYEVIEEATVPEEEGNDLLAAANAEAKAAKKDRDAKRKKAQEKLAKRRAALLEKQKASLKDAGVADAVVEELFEEVAQADQEADQHRSELESTLDQKLIDEESSKRAEFEAKMEAASTDEERADLNAAFQEDMAKTRASMDAERKSQRDKLNERLKKRKAGVQSKIDEKLAEVVDEEILQTGAEERAQIEEEAEAEAVTDDTANELSAAFQKDAAQLKATRDAKKAAAQKRLEERRKMMAAKHKTELVDAGAPVEVAEKQLKELDELAALEAKQLEQQETVMKKKEAKALAELEKEEQARLGEAENEELRAKMVSIQCRAAGVLLVCCLCRLTRPSHCKRLEPDLGLRVCACACVLMTAGCGFLEGAVRDEEEECGGTKETTKQAE